MRSSPTYAALMTATDGMVRPGSYLATEEHFASVKDLQARNLVVPVVGDFSGPTAIRAVGRSSRNARRSRVLSVQRRAVSRTGRDVGRLLRKRGDPSTDSSSTFIRSSNRWDGFGRGFVSSLGRMAAAVRSCGLFPATGCGPIRWGGRSGTESVCISLYTAKCKVWHENTSAPFRSTTSFPILWPLQVGESYPRMPRTGCIGRL